MMKIFNNKEEKRELPKFLADKLSEFEKNLQKHDEEQRQFSLLIISFLAQLSHHKEVN